MAVDAQSVDARSTEPRVVQSHVPGYAPHTAERVSDDQLAGRATFRIREVATISVAHCVRERPRSERI